MKLLQIMKTDNLKGIFKMIFEINLIFWIDFYFKNS